MTEPNDGRHLELIAAAQRRWIDALTDLGGRNTLLYYKDRRAGTLDLASADPEALERFEKTGGSRLTRLFKDADIRADAIHRMQTIYRKARELTEERGGQPGAAAQARQCVRRGDREAQPGADRRAARQGGRPRRDRKSQTIANLVAAMVARSRKVLFVAEKRAAIDAVQSALLGAGEAARVSARLAAGGELGLPDAAALAREVSPARNGSTALDTRRTLIALPAGNPVPARGLPRSNG